MKTLKTLLFATLLIFSSQISANTTDPKTDLKPVTKQVKTLFKKAKTTVIDKDIHVMINFKINDNNEISVTSIDSDDKEITNFIKTTLNKKVLSIDKSNKYRFYSIPVNFKKY